MRIFASTPLHVGPEELGRRQQRYDQISPDGVSIELHDLPANAPTQLNDAADIARSEQFVRDALAGAPADFDALLADCVLDPAVAELQGRLDRPVIGILRMNLAMCAALGVPMGAVVRNEAIATEMRRVADSYGWSRWLSGVEVLDLSFDAISEGTAWQEQLDAAAARVSGKGVGSLFNGCSAVDVDPDHPSAVPVFDPVIRALELVAVTR